MVRLRFALGLTSLALCMGLHAQMANPLGLGALPTSTPTATAPAYGAGGGAATVSGTPVIRSNDVLTTPQAQQGAARPGDSAQGNSALNAAANVSLLEQVRPNEFQRFVLETSGYKLPLFGLSFFDNLQFSQRAALVSNGGSAASMTGGVGFATPDQAPISGDYLLGVGDQLAIRGWGSIDLDVRTAIDRNGAINIPRVGAVPMVGVKAAQAESVLTKAISKYYKDFQISVTLAGLRGITVYVVGQARRPGSYSLSGVSTLASGLLATGGPGPNGSMRRVQLKRAGQLVREFDLYAFLARGDSTGDIKLIDGDVIVIPPALGYVALVGKVNNPAVYELKRNDETLAEILDVAGGLPVVADPKRATLERIQPEKTQPRSVLDFALNEQGLKTPLKNGDLLTIQAVLPELDNAVTLRGNVAHPTRLAWRQGLRIRDLIPSKQDLISRDSVRRQNEALFDSAQRERALRDRTATPEDLQTDAELDQRLMRSNRLGGRGAWGLQEQSGRLATPNGNAQQTNGNAQQNPISSPNAALGFNPPMTSLVDSIGNLYDEINWEYAVIERVKRKDLSVQLIPFNLGAVMEDPKHPDNQLLEPGDIVTVFSATDIRVPLDKRRIMVRVEGEVASPGIYAAKPDEGLPDLIQKAGGLTRNAYLFGAAFYREEVLKSQIENQAKLIRRLEAETATAVASLSQSSGASSDAGLTQVRVAAAQQARVQAIERVRSLKPEGRVALGLPPTLDNAEAKLPALRLQNGDRLLVPAIPDFVYIYGSVNIESSLIYRQGANVSDYLQQAGLGMAADRNNVILVRADGSALTSDAGWFGRSILNAKLMPGDAIVVPDKVDLEATWSAVVRNTKDISQIFYQLGLGAAAIKILKN